MSRKHKVICEICGTVFTLGQFWNGMLRCGHKKQRYYGVIDGRGGLGKRALGNEMIQIENLDMIVKVILVDAETCRLMDRDLDKDVGGWHLYGAKVLMDGCILVMEERDEI